MKKAPKTAFPKSWNTILESSKHKAGEKVFENIRKQKKLDSVLRSTFHNFSNEVSPGVEKEDLSPRLSVLKTSLDIYKSRFVNNEQQSWNLKLENSRVEEISLSTKMKMQDLEEKVRKLREGVVEVKEKQENEVDARNSLFYVFDRMRTTLVFLKNKKRKLWENLHLQDFSLDTNKKKFIKIKESLQITHQAFELFQNSIENEKSNKESKLQNVKTNVETIQKLATEKENHSHQEKILTEQILLTDQSDAMISLRKQYFSHFLWYMVSSQHFEKEKIKYKVYEDAYSKIKLATGISEVPIFVDRYLSQEDRYSEFVNAVKDKEEKVLNIKDRIEKMQKLIDNRTTGSDVDDKNKRLEPNAFRLSQKKVIDGLVKLKRVKMTKKKIQEWVKKIIPMISDTFSVPDSENLLILMTSLKNLVSEILQSKASKSSISAAMQKLKKRKNSEIIENLIKSKPV